MIAQIGKLNEDRLKISAPYLSYFLRNKPSKSVTVGPGQAGSDRVGLGRAGPGRFIILNDSAGPKMVIHLYLTFFRFF